MNAHHKEVADVYIEDGIIAAVQKNIMVMGSEMSDDLDFGN